MQEVSKFGRGLKFISFPAALTTIVDLNFVGFVIPVFFITTLVLTAIITVCYLFLRDIIFSYIDMKMTLGKDDEEKSKTFSFYIVNFLNRNLFGGVFAFLVIANIVLGLAYWAYVNKSPTVIEQVYTAISKNIEKTAENTEEIAKNTAEISTKLDDVNDNIKLTKQETSIDPQKELANKGIQFSVDGFESQLDIGNLENIELFFKAKFPLYTENANSQVLLAKVFWAKSPNYKEIIKLAIKYGFDINKPLNVNLLSAYAIKYKNSAMNQYVIQGLPFDDIFFVSKNFVKYYGDTKFDFVKFMMQSSNSLTKEDIDFLLSLGVKRDVLVQYNAELINLYKTANIKDRYLDYLKLMIPNKNESKNHRDFHDKYLQGYLKNGAHVSINEPVGGIIYFFNVNLPPEKNIEPLRKKILAERERIGLLLQN